MSGSDKDERIKGLLRKSLLGEELINTQFHLFTARSARSHKAIRPRALFANDILLVKSSDYFAKLLIEKHIADTLVDFSERCPYDDGLSLDEYDYASDSDLEDDEEIDLEPNATSEPSKSEEEKCCSKDPDLGDWQIEKSSDHGLTADAKEDINDRKRECVCDAIIAQPHAVVPTRSNTNNVRPRDIPSRHLFVKDTAFRTWQALLFYLYTDQILWSPLKSQIVNHSELTRDIAIDANPSGAPPCSPKSMYRLANKVGLEPLKNLAFDAMRARLSDSNIIRELGSNFTSKYPDVLRMQIDVLYKHIASKPVANHLPNFAERLAQGGMPHGAAVILELHLKMVSEVQYLPTVESRIRHLRLSF